jgi:hypothetical protein
LGNPNIRPSGEHSECSRIPYNEIFDSRVGDVRYCYHDKIQVRVQVGPNARVAGPGTDFWETLSPFWNPVRYPKAKKALSIA